MRGPRNKGCRILNSPPWFRALSLPISGGRKVPRRRRIRLAVGRIRHEAAGRFPAADGAELCEQDTRQVVGTPAFEKHQIAVLDGRAEPVSSILQRREIPTLRRIHTGCNRGF